MSDQVYDFVVVGGGAAGCVLANRLSADPANRVLLLEAGKSDPFWDVFTHMPAAMGLAIASESHNWHFQSEPEPFMNNRRMDQPRGKLLGGSGSINAMTFVRGHPANFDEWARVTGDEAWDYEHVLPYFKRIEDSLSFGGNEYRGRGGLQTVEKAPADHPLFSLFFEAAQQAGYNLTADLNGAVQEGFAAFDRNIRRGRRQSSSQAYLHPVMGRPNLEVRTHALATQVIFSGNRAVGVTYRTSDGERIVRAKEIVLSGGAFNTPQLLQLSGVGRPDELAAVGVAPLHELRGVGYNLEDHLAVQVQHSCTQPISMVHMKDKKNWPKMGLQWLAGRGPATSNMFEAAGFIRSNDDMAFPDVIIGFAAMAMKFDEKRIVDGHGYQVHVGTMAARSRGSVTLKSADPTQHPRIVFNYLDNQRDRDDWVKAIRIARDIMSQPAFAGVDGGEVVPGPAVQTDEELIAWVAEAAQTGLHPTGSVRMGTTADDVVDPSSMRVHGLEGLRVVDASVFPTVTNTQTYAPTLMVAEKASDMILGNTPLEAVRLARPEVVSQARPSAAPDAVVSPVGSA
ncbi:choline dehydrogenase [Pseudonocardia sp. WMMC193]|uniref:choline dehydrogenase n=1 Tax=Pseudonocardia sp. WMMC193 TaxID=2911965 RepID=UPI001F02E71A|nr:choline dehydrogenase [Pseudonocardia sp. WMMC193]MCF7549020.1 choline dehydrogenase [Pseudonocardia sp. WMMC193]